MMESWEINLNIAMKREGGHASNPLPFRYSNTLAIESILGRMEFDACWQNELFLVWM